MVSPQSPCPSGCALALPRPTPPCPDRPRDKPGRAYRCRWRCGGSSCLWWPPVRTDTHETGGNSVTHHSRQSKPHPWAMVRAMRTSHLCLMSPLNLRSPQEPTTPPAHRIPRRRNPTPQARTHLVLGAEDRDGLWVKVLEQLVHALLQRRALFRAGELLQHQKSCNWSGTVGFGGVLAGGNRNCQSLACRSATGAWPIRARAWLCAPLIASAHQPLRVP